MCQLYVDGPDKLNCSDQCFGCRKTKPEECFLCKHFTHQLQCVTQCPDNTYVTETSISKFLLSMLETWTKFVLMFFSKTV